MCQCSMHMFKPMQRSKSTCDSPNFLICGLRDIIRSLSQKPLCLAVFIFVENDVTIIFDEAALSECTVERPERILKTNCQY